MNDKEENIVTFGATSATLSTLDPSVEIQLPDEPYWDDANFSATYEPKKGVRVSKSFATKHEYDKFKFEWKLYRRWK